MLYAILILALIVVIEGIAFYILLNKRKSESLDVYQKEISDKKKELQDLNVQLEQIKKEIKVMEDKNKNLSKEIGDVEKGDVKVSDDDFNSALHQSDK